MRLVIAILLVSLLATVVSAARLHFVYEQFSNSPALSRGEGDSIYPLDANYGIAKLWEYYAAFFTRTICGADNEVTFSLQTNLTKTSIGNCNEYQKVRRTAGCTFPPGAPPRGKEELMAGIGAANRFPGDLGEIANGPPMGMNEDFHRIWMFKNGSIDVVYPTNGTRYLNAADLIERLAQDKPGDPFVTFPILFGLGQPSGFFRPDAIRFGLRTLCASGDRGRYLNPAQTILNNTCARLDAEGKLLGFYDIDFFPSIPGTAVLAFVQNATNNVEAGLRSPMGCAATNSCPPVTFFEFASAHDDWDALVGGFFPDIDSNELGGSPTCWGPNAVPYPNCLLNPGHLGLTKLLLEFWQQNVLTDFLFLRKTNGTGTFQNGTTYVLPGADSLSKCQLSALRAAGKAAVDEGLRRERSVECEYIDRALEQNIGEPQRFRNGTAIPNTSALIELAALSKWDYRYLEEETVKFFFASTGVDRVAVDAYYGFMNSTKGAPFKPTRYEDICGDECGKKKWCHDSACHDDEPCPGWKTPIMEGPDARDTVMSLFQTPWFVAIIVAAVVVVLGGIAIVIYLKHRRSPSYEIIRD